MENAWEDLFFNPGSIEFSDDGMVGFAYAREWDSRWDQISYGLEAQLNFHFGRNDYLELAVPGVVRWAPAWRVPIQSFAFGLGVSATSSVPQHEIDRGGASQTVLLYWLIETEFGPQASDWSGVLRLHHRSDGFGTIGDGGSSNFLALGLRRRF